MSEDKYEEIKLIFNLESQEENVIKCHINEKLINMFDLYCQIKNLKIDSVFLLYNGIVIENYNVTLDKLLNSASKSVGEAKILVIEKSKSLISNNSKMNDSYNDKKNIDISNKIISNNKNQQFENVNIFSQSQSQYINNIKNNINNFKAKVNMNNANLEKGINNNNNKFFSSTLINANGLQGNINGNAQPIPQFDNIKKNIQQNIDNNCYYNSSQSCVPSSNILKKAQMFTTAQNQPQSQKINGKQNEKYQNMKIIESKNLPNNNSNNIINNINNNSNNFPNPNNNNIKQNQKNNINNNMPPKKVEEIGLKTPGNEPLRSPNNNINANNKPNYICIKCKNPINNAIIPLCKNCFKNEIINECYFSYLSVLNQPKRPEEAIFANLNLINIKNEKINLNLDNALIRYNNLFPGLNFDRNSIVLELKKKICIYCTNEVKNNAFIELPCKCRICSVEHLNNYFTFYKDYLKPFTCRCKTTYNANMMFELALIKQLNKNNFIIIKNYFQKKLNSCCCICAKSTNIIGRSNQIVCLENPENNNFLRQIVHLFCDNCCRKYQNSEFTCHICHMKHYWNSN